MRSHFDRNLMRPALILRKSYLDEGIHSSTSPTIKVSLSSQDPIQYQKLVVKGKLAHLNDIKSSGVKRSEEGWNFPRMENGRLVSCDSCKDKEKPSQVVTEMFRSQMYPWQSDEEDDPYFYYCPRGRAAVQQKTYSTYSIPYKFRARYVRLFERKGKRRSRRNAGKTRRKVLRKTVKIRHSVRNAVSVFKAKRNRRLWERTITRVKLFHVTRSRKVGIGLQYNRKWWFVLFCFL